MDALTAPRAPRKTELTCQPRLRGDESDIKSSGDSSQSRQHEAAKPRGRLQRLFSFIKCCNKENISETAETMEFEPITVESLRQEKGYQKLARKQQKELETLRKRHVKERNSVQKQQCAAIEKLIKGKK